MSIEAFSQTLAAGSPVVRIESLSWDMVRE